MDVKDVNGHICKDTPYPVTVLNWSNVFPIHTGLRHKNLASYLGILEHNAYTLKRGTRTFFFFDDVDRHTFIKDLKEKGIKFKIPTLE